MTSKLNGELWKWIAACLFSLVLGVSGYAWGAMRSPSRLEVDKKISQAISPLTAAVQELKVEIRESRKERAKMRATLASLTAQLVYLERQR